MKKKGVTNNFMFTMVALSVSVVFLWVAFYFLTENVIRRNMRLQAETGSAAIIARVEEELLSLDNLAYALSHYDSVIKLADSKNPLNFYDLGGKIDVNDAVLSHADNIIVYNGDGLFYRVKGNIANTALMKANYLMESGEEGPLTVSFNNDTYIGPYKPIVSGGARKGFVLFLIEQSSLERILGEYGGMDYLKVALLSGNRVLASNFDIGDGKIDSMTDKAIFVKEKEIGLSGYRLLVFCERSILGSLTVYFRVALPVTIIILAVVLAFFVRYLKRHMVEPISAVMANTDMVGSKLLPHTGEAYFDDLVDHVNDMFIRIEDRERALYESEARIKEADLEKERTLVSLLKKQISAHFTVNTLNVVRALINKGEKQTAARICDELSTLLRYANAGDEYISLLEEFYVLEQYMSIMQARYPGRIEADFDEDDAFAEYYIPRMLIQPIIENAVVHGLSGNAGKISVSAEILPEDLKITVKDNGKGMSRGALKALIESIEDENSGESAELKHMALKNINRRIGMVCGSGYGIRIDSNEGEGTTVIVRLPLMKEKYNKR